jgi:gamma-glutamyltranspeptidase/glutathione hydrolase
MNPLHYRIAVAASGLLLSVSLAGAVSPRPVGATHGMVVSQQRLASQVGDAILRQGGNAIDAAVAVGYALAVTDPCCGNLGGGGFALIRLADGSEAFLNFRETAPAAATPGMFLDGRGEPIARLSLTGYLAAGVPGTVAGLEAMREKFATMPREALIAPAIDLAEKGFVLEQGDVDLLNYSTGYFELQPNVATIFLTNGAAKRAGETLLQRDLGSTLRQIAAGGVDAFYRGPVAAEVVAASKANGGIFSTEDFAKYQVEWANPVRCTYRGYTIVSAPPPSSGGTALCEILNILEGYPMHELGFHSAHAVHFMVEAMRHTFLDRNALLGDPAFVANPLNRLLSKDYAAQVRATIPPEQAMPSNRLTIGVAPHEGSETTHYSVVDAAGNAVAVTYTINGLFGAKVIAGNTGFFLNDEMDDFATKPGAANMFGLVQGQNNAIAPGKRPLSSMSPTIVLRDNQPFLVTGSPGGPRIITVTLETILNVIDYGMSVQAAVDAPRIHHQWLPDEVEVEPFGLSPDTEALLRSWGYTLHDQGPWGAAESIFVAPGALTGVRRDEPILFGANDNRSSAGAAVGH